MRVPDGQVMHGPVWTPDGTDLVYSLLANGTSRPDPGRRVEPKRLVERHIELGKPTLDLFVGRIAVAELAVLLVLEAGDHVRVAGKLVHQERERRGRRVVAREHQRHELVADFLVGKPRAVLVLGRGQHPKDVAAVAIGVGAPARDLFVDDLVERTP